MVGVCECERECEDMCAVYYTRFYFSLCVPQFLFISFVGSSFINCCRAAIRIRNSNHFQTSLFLCIPYFMYVVWLPNSHTHSTAEEEKEEIESERKTERRGRRVARLLLLLVAVVVVVTVIEPT